MKLRDIDKLLQDMKALDPENEMRTALGSAVALLLVTYVIGPRILRRHLARFVPGDVTVKQARSVLIATTWIGQYLGRSMRQGQLQHDDVQRGAAAFRARASALKGRGS